jgi:CubicO group peptidase (beta-lactamase class C family)
MDGRLPRTAPEAVGLPPGAVLGLIEGAAEQKLELHSLMVLRHGKVAAEGWWEPYKPPYRHLLYSLSKSFTSSAVGFAVAEGLIRLDDDVLDFFPEHAPPDPSPNLMAMTIWHLLTMTTGQDEDDVLGTVRSGLPWEKAFLARPVPNEPGSKFFYNSVATYMLSSIVHRTSGVDLMQYLKPRLLDPLCIEEATTTRSPEGVVCGGWGMSIATESIAKFGQLYLQKGVWNGEQLLPKGWAEEATRKQVENGVDPDSDWDQGYGFQFWRSRFGAFRGDGMYGQFCVVDAPKDLVVAITANSEVLQPILNLVWKMVEELEKPGTRTQAEMEEKLSSLVIAGPAGEPRSPLQAEVQGVTYESTGEDREANVTFDFSGDSCSILLNRADGPKNLEVGIGQWKEGKYGEARVASWGAWTSESQFEFRVQYLEEPLHATIRADFEGRLVTITRECRADSEVLVIGQSP